MGRVVVAPEVTDGYIAAAAAGVDKLAVADVNADVGGSARGICTGEEYQVSGNQLGRRYGVTIAIWSLATRFSETPNCR